jgi:hypothetical protein
MKRYLLSCVLVLSVPVCLYLGAAAQETATDGRTDPPAIEKKDGGATDRTSDNEVKPSGSDEATTLDSDGEEGTKTDAAKKEVKKKAERKKKEARKQTEKKAEEKKKETEQVEETSEGDVDRESGDNLLLIDHERIRYNRIPGITISKEEPGQDIVKIPDDKIFENKKEKPKGGLFGSRSDTIARWGLLILILAIFVIYKTRTKKSRKKVVRTITKR